MNTFQFLIVFERFSICNFNHLELILPILVALNYSLSFFLCKKVKKKKKIYNSKFVYSF
jgi:hypothetical protein